MTDSNSTSRAKASAAAAVKALAARKARREAGLPPLELKLTRQRAISAKCKDCIYDPLSGLGTWKQQTEACTITDCALWPFRPKSRAGPRPAKAHEGEEEPQR